jgi:histidine triad (HIT) family protein
LDAEGTFIAINNRVSQTVPHLHIHIVPRRRRDGLRGFFWPRQPYRDDDAREAVRDAIEHEVRKLLV